MKFEKLFSFFFLLFLSASSLSANDNTTLSCSPAETVEYITMDNVDISPSTPIGGALNAVKTINRQVGQCTYNGVSSSNMSPQPYVKYMADGFVSSNSYPNVTYNFGPVSCPVYKTGHDGIGISWANYNSGAGSWLCIRDKISRGLPQASSQSTNIRDTVVFVRASQSVAPGKFTYNKKLQAVYTAGINNGGKSKVGYSINVNGGGDIQIGECNIESGSKTVMLNSVLLKGVSNDPLNPSPLLSGNKIAMDIICTGFRENNVAYYKVTSDSYYDGNKKFAKSKDGSLGVSLNNGTVIEYDKAISINIVDVPNSVNNEGRGRIILTPSLYAKVADLKKITDADEPKVEIKIDETVPVKDR
ncbi:hypothetical protein [Morganella morganii]|uniref:hypothetical protein n=1 Tax=Morganella morganii TaxID=582 RepID=UPI003EBD0827